MSEVFKKYVPAAFTYIAARNLDIAQAAQALGISATAIGAAIAKENDAYETRQGAVGFLDRRLDDYVRLQTFRLGDTMLRSEATAATALGLDEQLKGTAGKALKFAFPTLADVGIANIKVSTAIKLLDDYLANYPADPLGLKDYRNDTGRFVRDLIDPRTPVTALVSALMVKEAQDFYLKPAVDGQGRQLNIDPATWGAMSPEVHDGLTTMYFTMGKNVMEAKRADNIARNGVYDPRLGEGDSGGLWTVQNAAEIGAALGVAGYGEAPINGLTLEPNTTLINLPNSSTGSSGLISYANDYSVRINAGGTLSHIVAAEAAKGNVISVADLLAVNYDIGGVADTAIPSGAVLLVPQRVGDSLVVDSGNARISFNPITGEYLAITQSSTNGPAFIYERKLVGGTLVDRFIQSDSAINGLDLTDGSFGPGITNYLSQVNATGENFGPERVRSQLQSTLDALNSIIAQTNSSNPDSNQHLGIIPQRLPSLNYRAAEFADKGYAVTDIDALTGAQRFHNIRFDDSGQVFNLDPASITPELRAMLSLSGAPNYPQLNAYMLNSALDRQAIAPLWEVKTARMQESAGDPNAGLTEEERAAKAGLGAAVDGAYVQSHPNDVNASKKRIGRFMPIGIDLDRNGSVSTLTNAQTGVSFDWDGLGYQKQTGWIAGNDGFLVLDRNFNQSADNATELLSNPLVADPAKGLRSLAVFDANADGKIDASDPVYAQLKVWQDLDQVGNNTQEGSTCLKNDSALRNLRAGWMSISCTQTLKEPVCEGFWRVAA